MASITHTASSGIFVPEEWAKEAELARTKKLVAANLVERKYESNLSAGDTVHIPFIGNMTADDVPVNGDALTPVAPSETEVNILVNRMKGKAVRITDWAAKQSAYDLAQIYGGRIGEALARAIDTDVLVELYNGTSGRTGDTAPTVTNGGTGATYAQIVSLVSKLDANDVPAEDRALVVNALLMSDLRQMPEFTRYDATGKDNPSVSGTPAASLVGWIYGIGVHMTNNVPVVAGTPNKSQNVLFHKSAVGLVVQREVKMEKDRVGLALSDDVIGSVLYGVKKLRNDHVAVLTRDA